jgi:hypothetical protein
MRKRGKRSYRSCFTRHEEQNAEAEKRLCKICIIPYERNMRKREKRSYRICFTRYEEQTAEAETSV